VRPEDGTLELGPRASSFVVRGTRFTLPVPGRHNVENALAALASASVVGVPPSELVAPLSTFKGVGRRFQTIGVANGVEVIDDFAHNPAKMIAALTTAQRRVAPSGGRVLAVYQPHGYGPTRFLREDFVETFVDTLGPTDRVYWLEVFYAGGTTVKDFSSADIVRQISGRGLSDRAQFADSRDTLVNMVAHEARPGDLILVMGARDPSLTGLARKIVDAMAAGVAERAPRS